MAIKVFLEDELNEKNELISSLKKELSDTNNSKDKLCKKIVAILDQFDGIIKFAELSQNEALVANLSSTMQIVRKELREVGFEEIATVGEIFNSDLHECVEAVEDETKTKYEIVDVIKDKNKN